MTYRELLKAITKAQILEAQALNAQAKLDWAIRSRNGEESWWEAEAEKALKQLDREVVW
jgi:hypothetical protein